MSYTFDIIFIDEVCPKPYETATLKHEGMGGSESSLIKIAEGLCLYSINIAVYQHNRVAPIMGERALYISKEILEQSTTKVVIHQRHISDLALHLFPKAKHMVWCHDLNQNYFRQNEGLLIEKDITLVCVSRWQRNQFRDVIHGVDIRYIYNPIHDALYELGKKNKTHNKLKLSWLSSPHKDLDYAIDVFNKIRAQSGLDFKLHVYNPGYLGVRGVGDPNVIFCGSLPNHKLLVDASDSLCLFMPMPKWPETFCIVAAEMNCLGIPVIAFKGKDALDETGNAGKYLCETESDVIKRVLQWHEHRPTVQGNTNFKLSNVLKDWIRIL